MADTYNKKQREKKRELKKKMKLEKKELKKENPSKGPQIDWANAPENKTLTPEERMNQESIKQHNTE
jgi:hypothetical protein